MTSSTYKSALIGTGIFALLLVLFLIWPVPNSFLPNQTRPTPEKFIHPPPNHPTESQTTPFPLPSSDNSIRIVPSAQQMQLPSIRYDTDHFTPKTIILQQDSQGLGCLLNIINDSDKELSIRLGPYIPGKEKGFPYLPIPARKSSPIDPRYDTATDLTFYDLDHPRATFSLHLDASCIQ